MDVELESIDWDTPSFTLAEFLEKYELPQIVCVRDGYLDVEEITTLSTDQVMTLHFMRPCKMLRGFSEIKPKESLSIPINTDGKIEILSDKLPTLYKSVKAIKNDHGVKKVLSLHSHAWLGIQEHDVLNIEGCIKKKHGKEYLRCSVDNRAGMIVELPTSYAACFHSYEEGKKIPIRDVEKHCTFPCMVKIKAHAPTKPDYDPEDKSEFLDLSGFGRIKLMGIYDYDKIITSIRYMDKVRILQVPVGLEITVSTGKEALVKDSKYNKLCKEVHSNTEFQQMEGENYEYVKMGEDKVDNIYEYIDFRYAKPPRPPSRSQSMTAKDSQSNKPVVPKRPEKPSTSPPPPTQQQLPSEASEFSIPEDITTLDVQGISKCLKYLNMNQYVAKFEEELIDGPMLVELSDEMIKESLGVTSPLHRTKIKKFINGWRPK